MILLFQVVVVGRESRSKLGGGGGEGANRKGRLEKGEEGGKG